MNENRLSQVKAMTFDVFGTVVDWRSSIAREIKEMGTEKGFTLDWDKFADEWRSGYQPSMNKVRTGELPWTKIDNLHRLILDDMLLQHQITDLTEKETDYLNRARHRLPTYTQSQIIPSTSECAFERPKDFTGPTIIPLPVGAPRGGLQKMRPRPLGGALDC